jgi:hypothetical protein
MHIGTQDRSVPAKINVSSNIGDNYENKRRPVHRENKSNPSTPLRTSLSPNGREQSRFQNPKSDSVFKRDEKLLQRALLNKQKT